jgi:RNA polymerase sigma factor (sigma-70 family)
MDAETAAQDLELLERARAGDAEAERALYVAHASSALRRARQAGAQPADAEDFVAEAFLRVFTQLRHGRGPTMHFRSYLLTTVARVAVDSRRGQAGREQASDLVPELAAAVGGNDPQDLVGTRLTVRAAMAHLPPRWRDVLWDVDVEGWSPAHVAAECGASAQSVHALVYRARRALRAELGRAGGHAASRPTRRARAS